MRATLAALLLAALVVAAPTAEAHAAGHAPQEGRVTVPPGEVARVTVPGFGGHDLLDWSWRTVSGNATNLTVTLTWTDASGARHVADERAGASGAGRFAGNGAPIEAELWFANGGTEEVVVAHSTSARLPLLRDPLALVTMIAPFVIAGGLIAFLTWRERRRERDAPPDEP